VCECDLVTRVSGLLGTASGTWLPAKSEVGLYILNGIAVWPTDPGNDKDAEYI
jgi:hypothetical protein